MQFLTVLYNNIDNIASIGLKYNTGTRIGKLIFVLYFTFSYFTLNNHLV
jgi:hypothetical protein